MAEKKVRDAGLRPGAAPAGPVPDREVAGAARGRRPDVDLATWDFRVFGEVEQELDARPGSEFNALPRSSHVRTSTASRAGAASTRAFEGVHWRELAKLCRPRATARFAIAHAEHGFTANVPLASLEDDDALLATHADGEPLTPEHGWPLRLVVPGKYFWKSAKWLRGIELSRGDRPGFWERYGYHNDADPWQEERYSF